MIVRALGRRGTSRGAIAGAFLACGSAACSLAGDTMRTESVTPAGPTAPCTASPSVTPFCTASECKCPLLSDDTIACPADQSIAPGSTPGGAMALASAPGGGGDLAFASANAASGTQEQEYVELGMFDGSGAATFLVDVLLPRPTTTSAARRAGVFVLATSAGVPIVLSTVGELSAAIGPSTPGGSFNVAQALAAPASADGWLLGGAVVEPGGGAVDVLVQDGTSTQVARLDAYGNWTTGAAPSYGLGEAAIAVDSTGVVYTAGWVESAAGGMADLEIVHGTLAPVVVATVDEAQATGMQLTVGQASDGSPLPVLAFGSTLTLAVPDGQGGFTTFPSALTVAQPYVNGCTASLSLGNCSCAATCAQTGDTVSSLQLVRDAQGNVYVAWLEDSVDMTYPVSLESTSVGSQMITCDCNPQLQSGSGSTTAMGLQLERLVMTPTPHTEHRGTIPVPSNALALQAVDGNGTLQLLTTAPATTAGVAGTVRRVVLDASKLP